MAVKVPATGVGSGRSVLSAAMAFALPMLLRSVSALAEQAPGPADPAQDVERICRDLSDIRGVRFNRPVEVRTQTRDDFLRYVRKSIARDYGPEGMSAYAHGLVRVGLLRDGVDLERTHAGLPRRRRAPAAAIRSGKSLRGAGSASRART